MNTVDILHLDEALPLAANAAQESAMKLFRGRGYVRRTGRRNGMTRPYFVVIDIASGTALGVIGYGGSFFRADNLPEGTRDENGYLRPAPYVI